MSNNPRPISELEEKIGYVFKNKKLIETALTHSSYYHENRDKKDIKYNERLEFLGDSVLSIVVSSYLFEKYKEKKEGDLTKIRAAVVCEKALSKFAKMLQLGEYLYLGNGEITNGGREKPSITADAMEALMAAMYIDSGEKFENVEKFILPFIIEEIDCINVDETLNDYKTSLQQLVQQAGGEILEYAVTGEEGPDHMRKFTVEARLNSNVIGRGQGKTKREAEQRAAKEALILFGELTENKI